jgi:hypothetical protein
MTNDGTEDPVPPPVLADPLSGLVTGGRYEPEPLKVRVVEPPVPDIAAVREAMEGMLDDDSELDLELVSQLVPRIPTQAAPADATSAATPPAAPATPEQEAKPAAAPTEPAPAAPAPDPAADAAPPVTDPAPTPPIGIPAQKKPDPAVPVKVIPPRPGERPRRLPLGWPRIRRRQAPPRPASAIGRKSSAPSVAAIVLLLLVIAVIAIVFLASLIDTFASIFS